MTRHISDQPREPGQNRLREFIRQERESGTHPAIRSLRSRPRDHDAEGRKTAEFLRIARGRTV